MRILKPLPLIFPVIPHPQDKQLKFSAHTSIIIPQNDTSTDKRAA